MLYRRSAVSMFRQKSSQPHTLPSKRRHVPPPTIANVLAPEFIGQAEHAALIRAMEDTPPACDGLESFTHDRFADPEQTGMMRGICRGCPLLELCRTFAIAGKPSAGMWAGMAPAEVRRGSMDH